MKEIQSGYYADELGNIYSDRKFNIPTVMKYAIDKGGYARVKLVGKTKKVHRLVAEAFIPNPENKCCVNHKNGNKSDNRVENLEWVTHQENTIHAYDTGLKIGYTGRKKSKLGITKEQVTEFQKLRDDGLSFQKIEDITLVPRKTISLCLKKSEEGFYNG